MARNKYPEITEEKILDVAMRLFLEKGYDNTTIQDIVDGLGGLTKGAIYHHFKSKEEIIEALGDKLFFDNNPFVTVQKQKSLNGLQSCVPWAMPIFSAFLTEEKRPSTEST